MVTRIFPSENDVHDTSGGGKKPTEANLTLLRNTAAAQISHYRNSAGEEKVDAGGILTGFDFSSGSATSVTLTAGTATIEGFAIEETTTIVGVLTASMFNYVFLTLDKSSGLVTDISLTVRAVATFGAAMTIPADSILIWCFETDGVSIITQFDFRTVGSNILTGSYTGDDAATRTFDLGFRPKMVHIYRNENNRFIARSPLAIPRIGTQQGLFTGSVASSRSVSEMTSDPELVPIIVENGFTIEDGPGSLGGIWLKGTDTFDPPNTVNGGTWFRNVTVTGITGPYCPGMITGNHDKMVLLEWEVETALTNILAADTVQIVFKNISGGARDLLSGLITVCAFQAAPSSWKLNELNQLYYFIAWY
jgi:hypothetical protein